MFCRMYITLIRPSSGSILRLCECFDPCDAETLIEIQQRTDAENPGWEILEILV